jgi:hypothetical protein
MGARRIRRDQRRVDQDISRTTNGHLKTKERARRALKIAKLIGEQKFPYTPVVMSYLSEQLEKPTTKITEEDVKAYTASQAQAKA